MLIIRSFDTLQISILSSRNSANSADAPRDRRALYVVMMQQCQYTLGRRLRASYATGVEHRNPYAILYLISLSFYWSIQ